MSRTRAACLCFALLPACDKEVAELERNDVEHLPPGSGEGSDASGAWAFTAHATACEGRCSGDNGVFVVSLCDVGDDFEDLAAVAQSDGTLEIVLPDRFFVPRMEGGIESDGGFEVGGFATQNGGELEFVGLMSGNIAADAISGGFDLSMRGEMNDDTIDCQGTYEVEGTREAVQ